MSEEMLKKAREIVMSAWNTPRSSSLTEDLIPVLATALDEARNEALEEVASLLEKSDDRGWISNCAYDVRALKTSPNESGE